MLRSWEQRPEITAHLLNPAFCGRVLYEAFKGYKSESKGNFPFALAFFILPIILHKSTREKIPSSRKTLHAWVEENNQIKISFPQRAKSLNPFTREAIMFLISYNAVSIDDEETLRLEN